MRTSSGCSRSTRQGPVARRDLFYHGVDQSGSYLPLQVADVLLSQVLPVLVANHVEAAVDGCVSFFEHHVHLGGELHVPHDCADPVHGAHAGAVAHELQADFFEVAALGGHGHRLGVENLTLALVHAEADGTDDFAGLAGQQLKDVDPAHEADAQLQGEGPELRVDVDGDARHVQRVGDEGQRGGVAVLIAGDLNAAVLHVIDVIPVNLQIPLEELLIVQEGGVGVYQISKGVHHAVRVLGGGADAVARLGGLAVPADDALVDHQNIQLWVVLLCPDSSGQAGHTTADDQNIRSKQFAVIFYLCHFHFASLAHFFSSSALYSSGSICSAEITWMSMTLFRQSISHW